MSQRATLHRQPDSQEGISIAGVTHGFGNGAVLEDVSLSVNRGETLAVIGPSGTGKTTLLRLLSLFERPDEGTVAIDDDDVWERSERDRLAVRRQLGMVFQSPNLFDGSVRANVSYGLRIRRDWGDRVSAWLSILLGDETEPQVERALDQVGLAEHADRDAGSLSGGEAQRVAFARALAYDPDFLFLDEPTSDLDPRNTAVIEDAIDAAREDGLGVVIATHDMHQAERIADRVAVLLNGEVIELGPAQRVFEDPRDRRAQKFIDGELVY
ncbi:amino acid ABC transporter ATP-binding protein [Halalkalirubrum salinum]|uniref:amino acid ABC transporter ATP-binding protein n=1 Tax=Halalkalirubrum salinum TaxID=2563889 RepID=UPI0010FB68C1|nr:phosphate ABC transporter ATP-binding protein [Halalkalirubrum salinum]